MKGKENLTSCSDEESENVPNKRLCSSKNSKKNNKEIAYAIDSIRNLILPYCKSTKSNLDEMEDSNVCITNGRILEIVFNYIKFRRIFELSSLGSSKKKINVIQNSLYICAKKTTKSAIESFRIFMVLLDSCGKCLMSLGDTHAHLGYEFFDLIGNSLISAVHPREKYVIANLLALDDLPPEDLEICNKCVDSHMSCNNTYVSCGIKKKLRFYELFRPKVSELSKYKHTVFHLRLKSQYELNVAPSAFQSYFSYRPVMTFACMLHQLESEKYRTNIASPGLERNLLFTISQFLPLSKTIKLGSNKKYRSIVSSVQFSSFHLLDLTVEKCDRYPTFRGKSLYQIIHPSNFKLVQLFHQNLLKMGRASLSFCTIRIADNEFIDIHIEGDLAFNCDDLSDGVIYLSHYIIRSRSTLSVSNEIGAVSKFQEEELMEESKISTCAENCEEEAVSIYQRCPFIPPPNTDQQVLPGDVFFDLSSFLQTFFSRIE